MTFYYYFNISVFLPCHPKLFEGNPQRPWLSLFSQITLWVSQGQKKNRFEFSMTIDLFVLRLHSFWDCVFETYRWQGGRFLVRVVYFRVDVSSSGRSLVQMSPTECGLYECDREASIMCSPWPTMWLPHLGGNQMTYSERCTDISRVTQIYVFRENSVVCLQNECRLPAFCQGR